MGIILPALTKALISIGMKFLSEQILETLIMWMLETAAKHTKTQYDDEIVAKIKELLDAKKEK